MFKPDLVPCQTCQNFNFLGCDGNSNNFPSRSSCERYCDVGGAIIPNPDQKAVEKERGLLAGCPNGGQAYRLGSSGAPQTCSGSLPCPSGYECSQVTIGSASNSYCCPTRGPPFIPIPSRPGLGCDREPLSLHLPASAQLGGHHRRLLLNDAHALVL